MEQAPHQPPQPPPAPPAPQLLHPRSAPAPSRTGTEQTEGTGLVLLDMDVGSVDSIVFMAVDHWKRRHELSEADAAEVGLTQLRVGQLR